jgi:hypothetical protein
MAMARNRLLAAFLTAAIGLAAVPGWSGEKPFFVVPDTAVDPRLRLESETWVLLFSGLEIRTRFLDPETQRNFLEQRAPDLANPFAPDGLFPEEHYLFRVDVNNGSDEPVTFHPGNFVMITNQNEQEVPLEYSDFYRRLVQKGESPESFLNRWTRVYYDGSHTLEPGESTSKLLAFHPPRDKWKRLMLYISFLQIGHETHNFKFPFSRTKNKKTAPLPIKEDEDRGDPS